MQSNLEFIPFESVLNGWVQKMYAKEEKKERGKEKEKGVKGSSIEVNKKF